MGNEEMKEEYMLCKCCGKFHSLELEEVMGEIVKDLQRPFYNGLSLNQISILADKLRMAGIKFTDEDIKRILLTK